MTQVKLWQIVSQTPNAIIFSDAEGNLKTLNAGSEGQVLVAGLDGSPLWVDNTALTMAIQAQNAASSAVDIAKAYTEAQIAALVDNAPVALNTLNELAQKLNGEDSAINALLLQVDGKAEKTEMDTAIALAKQEAIQSAMQHTDYSVGNAMDAATNQIAQATGDIIATAQQDAQWKADNAQSAAIAAANDFTNQQVSSAMGAARQDADKKATTAKTEAVTQAKDYTDAAIAQVASDAGLAAQQQADAAQTNATAAAAADASAKVAALHDAIPGNFWVEGTSTACFVAGSHNFDKGQALQGLPLSGFTEVTAATVNPSDRSLRPKLLFVNGVAMSDEWMVTSIMGGPLVIQLSQRLADHVFDGTQNSLMVLAEYRSYNNIALRA